MGLWRAVEGGRGVGSPVWCCVRVHRTDGACRGTHAYEVQPVEALPRDDGDELGLAEEGDFGGG